MSDDRSAIENELSHINEKLDVIFKKLEKGQYETRIAVLESEVTTCKKVLWGTVGLASTALLGVVGAVVTYLITH